MRLDRRDLTFLSVAACLITPNATPEERLRALELLEKELYPEGRKDSLVRALTGVGLSPSSEPAGEQIRSLSKQGT